MADPTKYLEHLGKTNGKGLAPVEAELFKRLRAEEQQVLRIEKDIKTYQKRIAELHQERVRALGRGEAFASLLVAAEVAREDAAVLESLPDPRRELPEHPFSDS